MPSTTFFGPNADSRDVRRANGAADWGAMLTARSPLPGCRPLSQAQLDEHKAVSYRNAADGLAQIASSPLRHGELTAKRARRAAESVELAKAADRITGTDPLSRGIRVWLGKRAEAAADEAIGNGPFSSQTVSTPTFREPTPSKLDWQEELDRDEGRQLANIALGLSWDQEFKRLNLQDRKAYLQSEAPNIAPLRELINRVTERLGPDAAERILGFLSRDAVPGLHPGDDTDQDHSSHASTKPGTMSPNAPGWSDWTTPSKPATGADYRPDRPGKSLAPLRLAKSLDLAHNLTVQGLLPEGAYRSILKVRDFKLRARSRQAWGAFKLDREYSDTIAAIRRAPIESADRDALLASIA